MINLENVTLDDEAREQLERVKKMREYKDPLLEEFDKEMTADTHSGTSSSPQKDAKSKGKANAEAESDSDEDEDSGDSSDESGSGSEEEGLDIEFPRQNAQDLLQHIQRDLVNMQDKADDQKRKFALIRLYKIFVLAKNKAPNRIYQELLPEVQKPIFKRLADKLEKSRELAALLIKEFFMRCDDLTLSIPYLLPILVERLRAEDLEGVDYLPDNEKPCANQKAQVMTNLVETSESVRVVLAEVVTVMVSSTMFECMRPYVDQFVNICKALCMDPFGDVIIEGTKAISEFSKAGGDQLVHFCEPMGRSLFTSFVHKHAKVRMAGLRALFDVLGTGCWKNSVYVFEHMMGFRDPNIVPIRDFFDPQTKVNYFAILVQDRSIAMRQCFYKTMGKILMDLPDRVDHEGRVFPYLVSGLFDPHEDICKTVFEIIEELGLRHEEDNEEKFREIKQFGYVPEWQFGGIIKDEHLELPAPLAHRPRIGARLLVKSYVRRYLKALYRELGEWIDEHQTRAARLLKYSICYVEEFMTQYCDHLLVAMYKTILNQDNKVVKSHLPYCFRLLGRYVSPKSYGPLIIDAIENKIASFYAYTAPGSLRAFGFMFAGSIELLQPGQNLDFIHPLLKSFISAIDKHVIESIDIETAHHLLETLDTMVTELIKKQSQGVDVSMCRSYLHRMLNYLLRCLAAFATYKFQKKQEPQLITEQKQRCEKVIRDLSSLCASDGSTSANFFDSQIVSVVEEAYVPLVEKFKKWAVEEAEREKQREEEKQAWLEAEKKRDAEAAKKRRTANKEAAMREKEAEAKMVEKAKAEEAFEQELRDKGESEEAIKAIMDQKEADEKEQEKEAARQRMRDLEASVKAEVAEKAEKEKEAEAEEQQADDQIVEKKEEKGSEGLQMQSQDDPSAMQVALTNQDQEPATEGAVAVPEAEVEHFDEILAVQHWAMQSPDWKLLNVLLELINDQQLQYKCKNGDSISEVFASVVQLALWKPYTGPTYKDDGMDEQSAMTQVRSYIIGSLLPSFVNKSLPFLSAELTVRYIELFDQAMDIEWHLRDSHDDKEAHMAKIQKMHQELLECKGVQFDAKLMPKYQGIFSRFLRTFAALRSDKLKQNGFFILRMYMVEYHKQLISQLATPVEQEAVMLGSQFLAQVTDSILEGLQDFHESVKEEAQQLLLCLARRFLPSHLNFTQEQHDLVQVLRSNMSQGWPPQLNGQLKAAAKLESEMLTYLFTNATGFLSKTITIYMDEHFGRENLMQFFKFLNAACPFLILNDYRIAKQGSALRRAEALEALAKLV